MSLSGRKGYLSLKDIGYGTGDGFGGWNCRHDWYPFFEGISVRNYTEERLREMNAKNIEYNSKRYTEYEISQMQRKFERDIRSLKREAIAYDTSRNNAPDDVLKQQFSDDFTAVSVKLKNKERQLRDFLEKTGQLPDNARTQVLGFGRSTAQKAVWAEKRANKVLTNAVGQPIIEVKKNLLIGEPNTITQCVNKKGGIERNYIGADKKQYKQIANNNHGKPKQHPYGDHGEHAHDYIYDDEGNLLKRTTRELNEIERKENADIL